MSGLIPPYILEIYNKFEKIGHQLYFVGGCVRNMLMEKEVKDWDLTTNATPEQILKLFPDGFYDNQFGTVGLSAESLEKVGIPVPPEHQKQVIEVTTFRTERGYSDKRRPDKVEWGKTIEEDLKRRDFTMNAIAAQLRTQDLGLRTSPLTPSPSPQPRLTRKGEGGGEGEKVGFHLIDPYKGKADIEQNLIRAVGNPDERFQEDALRLLRAIRFATELQFTIEEHTWTAIVANAKLIEHISGERIRIELLKILASEYPYEGIMMLKNAQVLGHILPELLEGVGVSQVRPGRHHTTDVFTHNVMSLKFCTSTDPIVRFATLLHDVGKPNVQATDDQGFVIFHNHEIVGARLARDICDRLKFSKKDRDKIVNLIRWHMFTVDEKITDAAVRRFIRRVGVEQVKDMMDLRIGDRLGGGTQTAESWRLKLFKKRVEEQLQPAPFSINDLAIDGHDIMKELDMKPGPKVGELLQKLFEEVDEDLSKNTKEYLLERLKKLV